MNKNRPVNILLIEDNPGDIRLAKEALKEGQLEVQLDVVLDGVEAIHFLRQEAPYQHSNRPDLILLDLNLPKKDGREVLEEIKKDSYLRCIPVVVLTSSIAEQDILQSYKLYVNCYVNKPLDFDRFSAIIKKIEDFWLDTAILPTMLH